jgi:hypothetical protein
MSLFASNRDELLQQFLNEAQDCANSLQLHAERISDTPLAATLGPVVRGRLLVMVPDMQHTAIYLRDSILQIRAERPRTMGNDDLVRHCIEQLSERLTQLSNIGAALADSSPGERVVLPVHLVVLDAVASLLGPFNRASEVAERYLYGEGG